MLWGWKGLLLALPRDTTHGSLSVHCVELPCNCFGLFHVNENKHINNFQDGVVVHVKKKVLYKVQGAPLVLLHFVHTLPFISFGACNASLHFAHMDMLHYWPMIFSFQSYITFVKSDVRNREGWFYHIWDTTPLWTARLSREIVTDGRRPGKVGLGKSELPRCSELSQSKETKTHK